MSTKARKQVNAAMRRRRNPGKARRSMQGTARILQSLMRAFNLTDADFLAMQRIGPKVTDVYDPADDDL